MLKRAAIVDESTGEVLNVVMVDDGEIPPHLTEGENISLVIDDAANFGDVFSSEEKTLSRAAIVEEESKG